jgi:acyl carrier protein
MAEEPGDGVTFAASKDGSELGTLATVAGVLQEILEDEVLASEITLETSFSADLELESIMFVALTERLNEIYGEAVDFVSWIAGLELEEIMELTVGNLVEHIDSCLS